MTYHIERMHYEEGRLALTEHDNVRHLRPETAIREVAREMCLVRDTSASDTLDGQFMQYEPGVWYAKIWDAASGEPIIEWLVVPTRH